jgi:hypothetical protein
MLGLQISIANQWQTFNYRGISGAREISVTHKKGKHAACCSERTIENMFARTAIFRGALMFVVAVALYRPTHLEAQKAAIDPQTANSASSEIAGNHSDDSEASPHRFWDHTNVLLFSGVAVFRGLDYASTRNMQARGREEILIPDDVVNNSAGFVSLEAAGAATSVGISYLLHRSGHHRLERWLSIAHIGITGFGAARNYALESRPRRRFVINVLKHT